MSHSRGSARVLVAATLLLAATACEPSVEQAAEAAGTPAPPAPAAPGTYRYDGTGGVSATLAADQDGWTLAVANSTGSTLGKPDIYALSAVDGTRIEASVEGSAPMPDRGKATLGVRFEREVAPRDLGLVLLLFGGRDFGPLAPGWVSSVG